MATATLISAEEYLRSSYEPDRDFIEGEVLERNMGERRHGRLQTRIGAWLLANERRYRVCTLTEVRLRIAERRYRIPDIMLLSADAPFEKVVITAPRLCIEILSPDDTMTDILNRIEDYFSIGVPVCWIVDPATGAGWNATPAGLTKAAGGIMRAGEIEMPLSEVLD